MNLDELNVKIKTLVEAIESCFNEKRFLPGLILLYSTIDILASLNRPKSHLNVQKKDFCEWVEKYLLPNCSFRCKTIDLYAARCSMIHTYMAESQLSRNEKANMIFYAWGKANEKELQEAISKMNKKNILALHVDKLLQALKKGIQDFKKSLSKDLEQKNLVIDRATKWFENIPYE